MRVQWKKRALALVVILVVFAVTFAEEMPVGELETQVPVQLQTSDTTTVENPSSVKPEDSEMPPSSEEVTSEEKNTPEDSVEADVSQPPESTQTAPADTNTPGDSVEADASQPPESTQTAPADTSAPEDQVEADASQSPESTEPAQTDEPNASTSPSVTDEPDTSVAPEAISIVGFLPLQMESASLTEKPSLEQVLEVLPGVLQATLSDGTTAEIPVTWVCGNYEETAEAYRFQATLAGDAYALAEGTAMPEFQLLIVQNSERTSGDYTYKLGENDVAMIVGYSGTAAQIAVPETLDGFKVVAIAKTAFSGKQTVKEVTLPNGLLALEGGAFAGCTALEKIIFPDSLENVGSGLFDGCDLLRTVQLNISMETTMANGKSYTRTVVVEEQEKEISVEIDREFTDFSVLSGGIWKVQGSICIHAEHAATVLPGGTMNLAASTELIVAGTLQCDGACTGDGSIWSCAGTVSGVDKTIDREHRWTDGTCIGCGARQAQQLTVRHATGQVERQYDGTNGLNLNAEDFILSGLRDGDEVSIAAMNYDFDNTAAGNYLTIVSFELAGKDAEYYTVLPVEIGVTIQKKTVTVTPHSGQSKIVGQADPSLRASYRGVIVGDTLAGTLSRESGEHAGKFRITAGNLNDLNPNYQIVLEEAYFTIEAKSIATAAVSVAKISNQRYTGDALTPDIQVREGSKLLKRGTDYEVSYESNVSVGTASVTIKGIGDYSGQRYSSFQIIRVGSSSGMSASGFFGAGQDEVYEPESLEDYGNGADWTERMTLTLGEEDVGEILFNADDSPRAFYQTEQRYFDDAVERRMLLIEPVVLDTFSEDGTAALPDEPRLRLLMPLIERLGAAGYTDIGLTYEGQEVRVPLATLYAEFIGMDATMRVQYYEIRLWPMNEENLGESEMRVLQGHVPLMQPGHFELLARMDGQDAPEDMLSLLEGVQLLLTPESTPDYQNREYLVATVRQDDAEMAQTPEKAAFIMEEGQVKCRVLPDFGGMYALVTEGAD